MCYACCCSIWDADTGKEMAKFEGHSKLVFSVAISTDGKTIVSGSWDNTIRLELSDGSTF